MIEREVLQDIRKYKKKVIGPFSLRELVCFVLALIVCVPTYFFLSKYLVRNAIIFVIVVLAIPFLLCGWKEVYGMPFEKYAFSVLKKICTRSKHRKYGSTNICDVLFEEPEIVLTSKEIKEMKKKQKKETDSRYIAI